MTDLAYRGTTEEITGYPDIEERDLVVEAVAVELENRDTAIWFQLLCENGPQAIEAQGWQLQAELKDRGVRASLRDVQDAMLELAHELLPESPAGEDPRQAIFREAGRWISRRPRADQERYRTALESGHTPGDGFQEAWDGSVASFRKFLRRCCQAAIGDAA